MSDIVIVGAKRTAGAKLKVRNTQGDMSPAEFTATALWIPGSRKEGRAPE